MKWFLFFLFAFWEEAKFHFMLYIFKMSVRKYIVKRSRSSMAVGTSKKVDLDVYNS